MCQYVIGCLIPTTELTDEEKNRFIAIKAEITRLNGVENASQLPPDMQEFLKMKAQSWRDHKRMAPRANTRAVIQDSRITLERISDEVCTHGCSLNCQSDSSL